MPSLRAERLFSPVTRASFFYFTLFMFMGVSNPYLAVWLGDLGLTTGEIGLINALPFFLMIVLNIAVGRVADRASDWRQVLVAISLIGGVTPALLFLVGDFWGLMIAWAAVMLPFQMMAPVADAATMRLARRRGVEFGYIRVWGTLGFVGAAVVSGYIFDLWGIGLFMALVLAATLVRALASLFLPRFRASGDEIGAEAQAEFHLHPLVATRLREVWRPWFFLPLLGVSLLQGSHMVLLGFGALLWREAGISSAVVGGMWAIAPASEVLVMLFFGRIVRRFSARHLIAAACVFGVVRWCGLAMQPPIWGIIALQTLHMGSFALAYLGIVNFIANWTTDDIAAQAQGAFAMIRQVVIVLSLSGFGFLVGEIGFGAYYVAGVLAALGGLMTVVSLMMMSPKTINETR